MPGTEPAGDREERRQRGTDPTRRGVGWLTAVAVAAALAINLAGIGAITVAQRGVLEEAARLLRLETAARSGALESMLASARADLAFLTGSPIFFGLESALGSRDPRVARWRRLEAEGALLLFLRGHPEASHLVARSDDGRVLVAAGRRGGVPVLWKPAEIEAEGAAPDGRGPAPGDREIRGHFEFATGVRRVSGTVALEVRISPEALMAHSRTVEDPSRTCMLTDRNGTVLAEEAGPAASSAVAADPPPRRIPPAPPGDLEEREDRIVAEGTVRGDGWSAPTPWRLRCARRPESALAVVEPLASTYRTTLMLNLAVMTLALLLGAFVVQQARRRQRLEAAAREEARVRELERQLFHAERLSTVGRLAAGMAHEINNPLEGMSNYLSLAREDLARGEVAAARRRLEAAEEGLRRAGEIVRRALQHADPARAPHIVLDLNAVLRQAVEFVGSRPEFRAIRFETDLAPGPLGVVGSQALLGQVFLNVLINACEAQPGGDEVRVTTRRDAGRVIAEIADRGPGVPAADSARIFEPFYSTKDSTGLGLSICYSIVTQHGGDLGVSSRPGGGAVFRLAFPAPAAAAPPEARVS